MGNPILDRFEAPAQAQQAARVTSQKERVTMERAARGGSRE